MKTLYVDCSFLAQAPHLNTGIQRVVRRVLENLQALTAHDPALRIQPVQMAHGRFEPVQLAQLYPSAAATASSPAQRRLQRYLRRVFDAGRDLLSALAADQPAVRRFLYAPRTQFGLAWLIERGVLRPLRALRQWRTRAVPATQGRSQALPVTPGDLLLLIDSTWNCDIWRSVSAFRQQGGKAVAVVYDLIPLTHPQFCDAGHIANFSRWLRDSVQQVDGYIGISRTVQQSLEDFLQREYPQQAARLPLDHFLLGGDFAYHAGETDSVRDALRSALSARPAYLMVSTVEPRKNHAYLLDAFEQLWARGVDVSLVIVGRTGWKVEALMRRIRNHPEYGRRLQHWSDLNDAELACCYQQARCLVFPSIVEGFGLPIVESLAQGLPVLASDTPIHREIGAQQIGYFDLARPADLAERIEAIEREGLPDALKVAESYRWLSWRDSSRQLLERVLAMGEGAGAGAGLESAGVSS